MRCDDANRRVCSLVPAKAQPVPSNGLIVVKKGEPVTLACEVTGNPLPVVTWTREVSAFSFISFHFV